MDVKAVKKKIDTLTSIEKISNNEIVSHLKAIVPEYISKNSEFEKLDTHKVKVKKLKIG